MKIRAVFFDIGETLIDETRPWSILAHRVGVTPMALFALLGRAIAERRDHREVFSELRPGLTWADVVRLGTEEEAAYLPGDLYPDARPCLEELRRSGYFVGIAGNQPAEREKDLIAMKLPADLVATSQGWGVQKPERAFFDRVVSECGFPAAAIVYVGDRADNDVLPASEAGLVPIHLVRGAWGHIQRDWPEVKRARAQLTSLSELPPLLESL